MPVRLCRLACPRKSSSEKLQHKWTQALGLDALERLQGLWKPGAEVTLGNSTPEVTEDPRDDCRVLYVSPLKALAVDVERNLAAPLAGIARAAEHRGDSYHRLSTAIRSGDTPGEERLRMARKPPDILITTPESLFLILSSNARSILASIEVVILDEIHALLGSKRGAHLALSVERVAELAGRELQRLGLSATQRPLDLVARYLGGGNPGRRWTPRPVTIADAGTRKAYDIRVEVPVEEMSRLGEVLDPGKGEKSERPASLVQRRSIWPAIHPRLLELIGAHRSTILFVNSRRLSERLAASLNKLAGEALVRAHHGSLAREERLLIEDQLKSGTLPALVATSTLELGIDMGAVDLVIQIETPPSVASGIQRIGRASHQAGAVSRGVLFPKYRGDLLATAAITSAIREAQVEPTRMPANPLDVLAQQVVSMVVAGERKVDDIFALVRRALPGFVAKPVRRGPGHAFRPLSIGTIRRIAPAPDMGPAARRSPAARGRARPCGRECRNHRSGTIPG